MRRRIRNKMQNLAQAVASSFSSSSGQYTLVCSSFPRGLSCCEKLTKLTRWSARLPENGFWISNFGYIVYIQDYRTVQRAHCTLVCSSFPRGLPWFRVLPSWIASYLLPPASCLLDCLGFAFCPLAVSYKPGSTVNRHSDKSLFLLTLHKSENEKRKQRG